MQAIGLSLNELFAPGDSTPAQTVPRHRGDAALARIASTPEAALAGTIQRRGQPTGAWTYRDVDGRPVLKVFRFDGPDGKEFRPVHPVGGGWAAGDPPGPLPLYRLPELEAAARVYVAEGEKAADAVAALGPGGHDLQPRGPGRRQDRLVGPGRQGGDPPARLRRPRRRLCQNRRRLAGRPRSQADGQGRAPRPALADRAADHLDVIPPLATIRRPGKDG